MNLPAVAMPKTGAGLSSVSKYLPFAMPVGGILVSVLVAYFVIWPKFGETLAMKTSNKQLDVQASQLQEKANDLASLSNDKPKLEQQLADAELILPSNDGIFQLLRTVETSAVSSGVLIEKIDVDAKSLSNGGDKSAAAPAQPDKNASAVAGLSPKVELKVAITGGYQSFLQFLSSLYSSSRAVSVDDLTITSSSTEGNNVVRASLTVDAYWKPLPTDLGSLDKPVDKLTDTEAAMLTKAHTQTESSASAVPQVTLGRKDLFAPF